MNLRLPLLAAFLFTAVPAFSLSFSFSYTFDAEPQPTVSGVFTGDWDGTGTFIDNIVVSSLKIQTMDGPLVLDAGSLQVSWVDVDWVYHPGGFFSTDLSQANFFFADGDLNLGLASQWFSASGGLVSLVHFDLAVWPMDEVGAPASNWEFGEVVPSVPDSASTSGLLLAAVAALIFVRAHVRNFAR